MHIIGIGGPSDHSALPEVGPGFEPLGPGCCGDDWERRFQMDDYLHGNPEAREKIDVQSPFGDERGDGVIRFVDGGPAFRSDRPTWI